jgi:hypothetical protein
LASSARACDAFDCRERQVAHMQATVAEAEDAKKQMLKMQVSLMKR